MQILCNVSLVLANPTRMVKLKAINITEQVVLRSNRLDELDES